MKMTLTPEEVANCNSKKLKRLTFNGCDDLYQTLHGAVTIKKAMELDEVQRQFRMRESALQAASPRQIKVSDELEMRNERCIEQYGCGSFGG